MKEEILRLRDAGTVLRILIGSLADGMKPEEILPEYPQLSPEDLLAALAYAADVTRSRAWPREA